ncbi:MAG: ATP-binding protein [Sarcina sp.]
MWKFVSMLLLILIIIIIRKNKKIKNKNKNFNYIINSMDEILCFKDENHRVINANDSFLNLFNIDKNFLGLTDDEIMLIRPDYKRELTKCKESDQEVEKTGKGVRFEENFLVHDGIYQTFDVVKTPIYDKNNKYLGLVVVGNDITDKMNAKKFKEIAEESSKMIMELQQYNEVRTDFFVNLSHEFRTPLNLILSSIKMKEYYGFHDKNYNIPKQDYYTKVIKQNTLRVTKLINNIIDTTKFETGHLECYLENHDIVNFIEGISTSVIAILESKGLNLIFDTNVEECIMAFDLDKMERIILNLLSNAIKFTGKDGKIFVNLEEEENYFNIYIEDTGIGIPIEKQKYVFERFAQVNKSTIRNREGSGIGLNLVKAFVLLHNGSINILNDGNKGTKFKISIPKIIISELTNNKISKQNSNIEVINIEFSDIYDIIY